MINLESLSSLISLSLSLQNSLVDIREEEFIIRALMINLESLSSLISLSYLSPDYFCSELSGYLFCCFRIYNLHFVLYCRDNSKICSCGGDRQVFYWDVSTGRVIRKFRGHDSEVSRFFASFTSS
ncbi:putative transcription factor WD40-like family [Helianthus anomalus]